jgi:hypothetical protein
MALALLPAHPTANLDSTLVAVPADS